VEQLSVSLLLGKLLALLENIRQGWKSFAGRNTLAYYGHGKSFITFWPQLVEGYSTEKSVSIVKIFKRNAKQVDNSSGEQFYKTFYERNLQLFVIS
jgi:hypothetical protein